MINYIQAIVQYNNIMWLRVWDSILQVSDEQFVQEVRYSQGSLQIQMVHLLTVEGVYLRALQANTMWKRYGLQEAECVDQYSLHAVAKRNAKEWSAYIENLPEAALQETVQGMIGPTWQIIVHVVNHGTDHRAQVLRLLHDYGAPTIEQDMLLNWYPNLRTWASSEVSKRHLLNDFSEAQLAATTKVKAPLDALRAQHLTLNKYVRSQPSLSQIQAAYPANQTIKLERSNAGFTRSDAYFGECILNGMAASILDQHPTKHHQLWLFQQWNSYEQNGRFALPNVDMRFEQQNGSLVPTQITLQLRKAGCKEPHAPLMPARTLTPTDGVAWQNAKHVARVSSMLSAELDNHLVTTHLNVEQYAVPLYRHIQNNPLRLLLFPHIKGISAINQMARQLLIGEEGFVPLASPLTSSAIDQRIQQTLGMLDWLGWQPRPPVCADHHYAYAAQLFWQILGTVVDQFFAEHEAGIATYWGEVRDFSAELITNSAPPFLCGYLKHTISSDDWFNDSERTIPAPTKMTAVSSVTVNNQPDATDIARLKQLCRYVMMHATFMHSWGTRLHFAELGELAYAGLGLRFTLNALDKPFAHAQLPPPRVAIEQLYHAKMLSSVHNNSIVVDEEGDIYPPLRQMLIQHADVFAQHGITVDAIQSHISI